MEQLAKLLPQYDFKAFIAQGGMGAVYLATQPGLDRDVAIKILPREFGADSDFRKSFEAEAKAMAKLNHPNLIGVYDCGDADGMPYIVMEYVNGESLYHAAYDSRIDPVQAATIIRRITDGLAHAHAQGIIHRDIKPANVLLNTAAEPKIGDFGLARPAGKGESGVVMGTPGYVAPEVLNHPDQADRRSDIFAVGVMFYELLTGRRPPFASTPPASTVCGCSIALDRICDKAMNPTAALRYQSADELALELGSWLSRQNPKPGPNPLGGPRKGPPAPRRATTVVRKKQSSGGRFIVLAVIAVLGFLGWKYYKNQKPTPTPPAKTTGTSPSGSGSGMLEGLGSGKSPAKPSPSAGGTGAIDAFGSASGGTDGADNTFGSAQNPSTGNSSGTTHASPNTRDDAPSGPPPAAIAELDARAKELIGNLGKERTTTLETNAKNFIWGLDSIIRNLRKSEREEIEADVASLKEMVTDNRIPANTDELSLSEKMIELHESCIKKQEEADEVFQSKAERIRTFYADNMDKLASTGDAQTAPFAKARARAAANLDDWLSALGFSLSAAPENHSPSSFGSEKRTPAAADASKISGRWRHMAKGDLIILDRDGSMRCVDGTGTWTVENANVVIKWGGAGINTLAPDASGDQLVGSNNNGKRVTYIRDSSVRAGISKPGGGEIAGWWNWDKPNGPVIEIRNDGTAFNHGDNTKAQWSAKRRTGTMIYSIEWLTGKYAGDVNEMKLSDNDKTLESVDKNRLKATRCRDF